ncbi:hypothetical protein V8C35DRAFT_286161 [Trichoderma chlorosporum]
MIFTSTNYPHPPSIPALGHQSTSPGPAPGQTLLWLDGFDGFWPASAHFPRRHTIPLCCFVLHQANQSRCFVPFFLFSRWPSRRLPVRPSS